MLCEVLICVMSGFGRPGLNGKKSDLFELAEQKVPLAERILELISGDPWGVTGGLRGSPGRAANSHAWSVWPSLEQRVS